MTPPTNKPAKQGDDRFWKDRQGKNHRMKGPAIEWASGKKDWFIQGYWQASQFGQDSPNEYLDRFYDLPYPGRGMQSNFLERKP